MQRGVISDDIDGCEPSTTKADAIKAEKMSKYTGWSQLLVGAMPIHCYVLTDVTQSISQFTDWPQLFQIKADDHCLCDTQYTLRCVTKWP